MNEEKLYTLYEILDNGSEEIDEIVLHLDSDELKVLEAILELKSYGTYDKEKKETFYTLDEVQDAVDDIGNTTYFLDEDAYYDYCDELLEFPKDYSLLERYFDYDAYHHDCMYDVSEASNGVLLSDW